MRKRVKLLLSASFSILILFTVCSDVLAVDLDYYYEKYREYLEEDGEDKISVTDFLSGQYDGESGEEAEIGEKIDSFYDSLPDEIAELVPDSRGKDPSSAIEKYSVSYFVDAITSVLKRMSGGCAYHAGALVFLILIS